MHSTLLWRLSTLLLTVFLAVDCARSTRFRDNAGRRRHQVYDDDYYYYEYEHNDYEDQQVSKPPQLPHPDEWSANSSRIVNGRPSEPGEFPYIVRIWTSTQQAACSGTIYDERHILTAAHCLVDQNGKPIPPKHILLYVGDYKMDEQDGETLISVYQTAIHPKYKDDPRQGRLINDVGIIETFEMIILSLGNDGYGKVMPLPPLRPGELATLDNKFTAAGWGLTAQGEKTNIMWTYDTVSEPCQDKRVRLDPQYLCTPKGKTACHGDSGGPLIYKTPNGPIQVGIVSFIPGGKCGEAQTFYMSLDYFILDIQKMVSELKAKRRTSRPGRGKWARNQRRINFH